jgi:hypothetical protein
MNNNNNKPLYTLTIGEFTCLIQDVINSGSKDKLERDDNPKVIEEEFTIPELAVFLRKTKGTVHNYKKLGLPFLKIGRTVLFKKSEVIEFMKNVPKQKNKTNKK